MRQETRPLLSTGDSFKKVIIVKDNIKAWHTGEGILVLGLFDFFLTPNSLDL